MTLRIQNATRSLSIDSIPFMLLILSCVYDKSGLVVNFQDRFVSISVYKLLILFLITIYTMDFLRHKYIAVDAIFNRRLYRILWVCIIVQTCASFLGNFVTPGRIVLSSEFFYLIQRLGTVLIPLLAVRYKVSCKHTLILFIISIILHCFFISLQFISPVTYFSFIEFFSDAFRRDNIWEWDGSSFAFIGLQRTSNYGTFVSMFLLLTLAFRPKGIISKFVLYTLLLFSLFIAVFGNSRSALIFFTATLLIYFNRINIFSTVQSIFTSIVIVVVFGIVYVVSSPDIESLSSIYRFFNPDTEGSNLGKFFILNLSYDLFWQSPILGWGQKGFANISYDFGNLSHSTSEAHFYFLNILLTSGIIGLTASLVITYQIMKSLWRKKTIDSIVVCAVFIGLTLYSLIYDAGSLDVFSCFFGIASYYALSNDDS